MSNPSTRKTRWPKGVWSLGLAIAIVGMLIFPALASSPLAVSKSQPVFIWAFGYFGDNYLPQQQLNLSPTQVLAAIKTVSESVGLSNLQVVTVVQQGDGMMIQHSFIGTIANYVQAIRGYASVVYCSIDLNIFTMTSSPSVYTEESFYVNQLHCNGIWLDHAPLYYAKVGQAGFNAMMSQLHSSFPSVQFILNNAITPLIIPLAGASWVSVSYVSPTTKGGTDDSLNTKQLSTLIQDYNGRVLIHLDSFSQSAKAPMCVFADQTNSTEVQAVEYDSTQGASFLIPFIGGATSISSQYNGALYNGLSIGLYPRDTIGVFLTAAGA